MAYTGHAAPDNPFVIGVARGEAAQFPDPVFSRFRHGVADTHR